MNDTQMRREINQALKASGGSYYQAMKDLVYTNCRQHGHCLQQHPCCEEMYCVMCDAKDTNVRFIYVYVSIQQPHMDRPSWRWEILDREMDLFCFTWNEQTAMQYCLAENANETNEIEWPAQIKGASAWVCMSLSPIGSV